MIKKIFQKSGEEAVYIAEIGLNHNGDINAAQQLIEAAVRSGADGVKFQTFMPEKMNSLFTRSLLEQGYENDPDSEHIDFFKDLALKEDDLIRLADFSESLGVVFFSSPFDIDSVEMLERIGVPVYKVASSEITNHRLIKRIAETGKPVLLSTGMTDEDEIAMALDILKSAGSGDVMLLHCVSLYPAAPESVNLNRIISLREKFHLEVGFSSHYPGYEACLLALALGVRFFESHFTLRSDFECPDRAVSLTPERFSHMVKAVESARLMLGSGNISCAGAETVTARAARRSIFARRTIPAGKIIEEEDLIALRPGSGIPAYRIDEFIGRKSRVNIKKDYMIRHEYFE